MINIVIIIKQLQVILVLLFVPAIYGITQIPDSEENAIGWTAYILGLLAIGVVWWYRKYF